MTEIDPMVLEYGEAVLRGITFEDSLAARGDYANHLAVELTERLQRPSREEVALAVEGAANAYHLYLKNETEPNRFAWIVQSQAVVDLVCGPEPKPKGVRIRLDGPATLACLKGSHGNCDGVLNPCPTHEGICVCPCDCHKESAYTYSTGGTLAQEASDAD